jgi:hypothetical protein
MNIGQLVQKVALGDTQTSIDRKMASEFVLLGERK